MKTFNEARTAVNKVVELLNLSWIPFDYAAFTKENDYLERFGDFTADRLEIIEAKLKEAGAVFFCDGEAYVQMDGMAVNVEYTADMVRLSAPLDWKPFLEFAKLCERNENK